MCRNTLARENIFFLLTILLSDYKHGITKKLYLKLTEKK